MGLRRLGSGASPNIGVINIGRTCYHSNGRFCRCINTTNFTIRQIAEHAGVSKSAVHDIWKHAQHKARTKKENCNPPSDNHPGDNPSGDNPSGENPPAGDNPSSDNLYSDNPINGGQDKTQMEVTACTELSLVELLSAVVPDKQTGRPEALTEDEKDHLVATVKRDFETRRKSLVELQCEAGLGHVCLRTILRALNERGLKCCQEEFKFIRNTDKKARRLVYCEARKN